MRRRRRAARVARAAAPAADGGCCGADRAPQQSRPAGRLQRARDRRGRDGGGEPAANPDVFDRAAVRSARDRDRAADRRQYSWRWRRCRRARTSPPTVSGRRNCGRPRRRLRVAAETRRAYYRAVAARAAARFPGAGAEIGGRDGDASSRRRLGETGAMNKLDQAREQVFYAEITAQLATARQRAASERERLVRAMGLWGDDLDFKLPGDAAGACRARPHALPDVEIEAVRAPRRSADRAHRGRGAGQVLRADAGDALHQSARSRGHPQDHEGPRDRRDGTRRAASRSNSRFRCSISARCACGRPSRPTCRRSIG